MTAMNPFRMLTEEKIGYYFKKQWIAIAWTARCSAFLSIVGSSTILFMILRRRKVRLALVHNRIILVMSTIDIFSSLTWIVGPLAAPASENGISVYGARGNSATCAIQAYVFSVGFSTPLYNACLCLVYLSVIRYNTPDDVLMKRLKFMHMFALGVALLIATPGAVTNEYTTDGADICWYPENTTSIGRKLAVYFFALAITIIIGSMVLIYMTVRDQTQQMKKYTTFQRTSAGHNHAGSCASNNDANGNASFGSNEGARISERHEQGNIGAQRETAQQSYLFVGAFCSTHIFSFADIFISGRYFALMILIAIFYPLQGFWNFIIFLRPKLVEMKRRNRLKPFRWILLKAIFSSVEEEEQKKTAARQRSFILRRRNKGASTGSHGGSTNSKARNSGGSDISRLKAILGDSSTTEQVSSTKNETLVSPLEENEEDVKHEEKNIEEELVSLEEGIDESMIIEQDNDQQDKKLVGDSELLEMEDLMHESLENVDAVFSD